MNWKKIITWIFGLRDAWRHDITEYIDKFKVDTKQDPRDPRDYEKSVLAKLMLPSEIDYTPHVPPIKHQGNIGSCGSHAAATGLEMLQNMKEKRWAIPLSELFHYYVVRSADYENTLPNDSGQHGRQAMKVMHQMGITPEKLYPYETYNYNIQPRLWTLVKSMARFWKITRYERCYSLQAIKTALKEKKAVWLGVPVRRNIYDYKTGNLTYNKNFNALGGHAMLVCGYNDEKKALRLANSWGTGWGEKGYAWMSYDYLYKVEWFDAWAFDLVPRHY